MSTMLLLLLLLLTLQYLGETSAVKKHKAG